jgi:KDO2-lipid IV(A) lauroyltransferase
MFIVRKDNLYGHQAIVEDPIYYEDTGDQEADDYKVTVKMTQAVEAIIKKYPDSWLWFQHRWNTPYTPPAEEADTHEK